MILNSSDVSASGVTLVRANHVIFLHPLFVSNQHEFDSKERQAIGRVRRPGQERDIHLYRFYVEHSLDHDILNSRKWANLDNYSSLTQIHSNDIVYEHASEYTKPTNWIKNTTIGGIVPKQFSEFFTLDSLGKNKIPQESKKKPKTNNKIIKAKKNKRSLIYTGSKKKEKKRVIKKMKKKTKNITITMESDDENSDDDFVEEVKNKRKRSKGSKKQLKRSRVAGSRRSSRSRKEVNYAEFEGYESDYFSDLSD